MDRQDFVSASEHFLSWFKAIPGSTFHNDLSMADLRSRNAGRGLAVITASTSSLAEKLPHILTKDGAVLPDGSSDGPNSSDPDPWIGLILVLIYEYLQGEHSPWKPYFDVFPEEFDTPMFWTEEELDQLQSSSLRSKIGKEKADSMFITKVIPCVNTHTSVFYPEGRTTLNEAELLALSHRMASIIMAYAFDLDKDDDEGLPEGDSDDEWVEDKETSMLGMVPMADILNSDAEFNAHVDHDDNVVTVTSLRTIREGEEILNYYGPLANSDLLRRYGYVSNLHRRYDVVEIPRSMVAAHVQMALGVSEAFKEKAMSFLGDDVEESIVLERDSGEPNSDGTLIAPIRTDRLLSELEEATTTILKSFRKVSASVVPDKRKREETCRGVLPLILSTRLAEYQTSVADDELVLADPQTAGRLRMAVEVRAGEKRLLHEALALAAASASSDADANQNGSDRPNKKTKVL
ncbi:SET domain-containing protein [Scedosporium apiospermum]|uniref:SET domain-containing protein n=1 Tax=Pseudallescheria apiosperma TaxID=563466 RepID=A0A084FXF3_PSEDA|nr:SET domain-containing protein [Scedosporium apiospermum]KEZ39765.1 SET domain-containing protein [Scedosporium apiospermum]